MKMMGETLRIMKPVKERYAIESVGEQFVRLFNGVARE